MLSDSLIFLFQEAGTEASFEKFQQPGTQGYNKNQRTTQSLLKVESF
jgi:hypothetical protein